MAKLVLSLSSVISSNKEGRFSSAALGLVKAIGREKPSSAVTLSLCPGQGFSVGEQPWCFVVLCSTDTGLKSLLQALEV